MTPFRRNAIVNKEPHVPGWLYKAIEEQHRMWREASCLIRLYWNVSWWFKSKMRMAKQWSNLRKRGYKL